MSGILYAKVISILDNQRIVINAGLSQGVRSGNPFFIYELGDEMIDLETKESLGQLEIVKANMEAYSVQDRLTVLIPTVSAGSKVGAVLSETLSQIYQSDSKEILPNRGSLNVRQDQIHGLKRTTPIAIGDLVRSVHPFA